jgi:hypothetical protein
MTKRKSYFINVLELATRNKMALDFLLRDRLLKISIGALCIH